MVLPCPVGSLTRRRGGEGVEFPKDEYLCDDLIMNLSDNEKRDAIKYVEAEKPLPEKYACI